ncbi:unnamed protein product, partial [Prorocentrum cordatum]
MGNPPHGSKKYYEKLQANKERLATKRAVNFLKKPEIKKAVQKAARSNQRYRNLYGQTTRADHWMTEYNKLYYKHEAPLRGAGRAGAEPRQGAGLAQVREQRQGLAAKARRALALETKKDAPFMLVPPPPPAHPPPLLLPSSHGHGPPPWRAWGRAVPEGVVPLGWLIE